MRTYQRCIKRKSMNQFNILMRKKVLSVTDKYCLAYKKGYLYLYQKDNAWTIIDKKKIGTLLNYFTHIERLLRREPRCAVMIDSDNCIISYRGKVLHYDFISKVLKEEHSYISAMNNPLSFCKVQSQNGETSIYYGEYFGNVGKSPVSIYRRKSDEWEKVYEFPSNTINHIHGIEYNMETETFYIMTGDEDRESAIWISDEDFSDVHMLVGGKQKYRACVAFLTDEGLIYATDTPLEENYIYKVGIKEGNVSFVKQLHELPGSCIYGAKIGDNIYFATAVEPDSSLNKWRYRFTLKRGLGIKDNYSHIFMLDSKGELNEIFKRKKDVLPMWLFQFGNCMFPYNETNTLVFSCQALSGLHGATMIWRRR